MKKINNFFVMALALICVFALVGCQTKVKEITINGDDSGYVGDVIHLTAAISPDTADYDSVEWTSENEELATIDVNGDVTLKAVGQAKIKATIGEIEADFTITISVAPITTTLLVEGDTTGQVGNTIQLTGTTNSEENIVWASSDDTIATVDQSGLVTLISKGDVTITATVDGVSSTITITATVSLTLSGEETGEAGSTIQLTAETNSEETITWESSDSAIATVSDSGLITLVSEGSVTITATVDGVEATKTITVTKPAPTINISGTGRVQVGETTQLTATIENSDENPVWTSSDESVATVDQNGLVTVLKEGKAVITATIGDISDYKNITGLILTIHIGDKSYETLADAAMVWEDGDVVTLDAGTYSDNLVIDKSIKIYGPNRDIDPNSGVRVEEAIMTGLIEIKGNTLGVTLDGLSFTGSASISAQDTENVVDTFTFSYNKVYDMETEPTAAWVRTRNYDVECFMDLGCYGNKLTNTIIRNNSFDNIAKCNVYIATAETVTVKNNSFTNFKRDAVRLDGGYNYGLWSFVNNSFVNDELSGYNGLYFRSVGSPQSVYGTDASQKVTISSNYFKNIGQVNTQYSGAISTDAYQEHGMVWTVDYNTFEDCENFVWIRNNATAANYAAAEYLCNVNYNKFIGEPTAWYFQNMRSDPMESIDTNPEMANFDYNLFIDDSGAVITDSQTITAKCIGVKNFAGCVASEEELQKIILPTTISFTNSETEIKVDNYLQLGLTFDDACNYKGVDFFSSNESIATVSTTGKVIGLTAGTVTITVKSDVDATISNTYELTVLPYTALELRYEGNSVLAPGSTLQITSEAVNVENANISFATSDSSVATVDENGLVTAVGEGIVTITATDATSGNASTIDLTVKDMTTASELLQLLAESNNGVIWNKNIQYIGWEAGYTYEDNARCNVYGAANMYYAAELPEITLNMLPEGSKTSGVMTSIEYITVHDTAGGGPASDAAANSGWCTNASNTGSSWHYTIGNDGIYQQMEDNMSAWHCGDGASTPMCNIDTGVKAPANASEKPEITISSDGYFVIDGTKSTYEAPLIDGQIPTTADIAPLGMLTIIGDNGNYFMHAYYNSTYKVIASYGGLNTIGIETAVNYGSDIFLTWQRLAKFVAAKEVQYDLGYERVCYHNNLSGKTCPNSMMHADMIDYFEKMVKVEWTIAHDYSDYTITFNSSNPEVLDNSGRVVGDGPQMTTSVPYTVTVTNTNTGVSESMTLNTVVIGQQSKPAMELAPSVNPYTGISE